ncbi:MAG: hypothetical protein Q7V62_08645, partial [Actinomycetota bacterium]|nr:hypothetical protein [Actinomycetota bacterium]
MSQQLYHHLRLEPSEVRAIGTHGVEEVHIGDASRYTPLASPGEEKGEDEGEEAVVLDQPISRVTCGDKVWGFVPNALIAYQRGRLRSSDCTEAHHQRKARPPAFVAWPEVRGQVNLDQLPAVCARRLDFYRRLEVSLAALEDDVPRAGSHADVWSYVCLASAAARSEDAHVRSVFLRGEAALDAYRLVHGMVDTCALIGSLDSVDVLDVTEAMRGVRLGDNGLRFLGGGRASVPLAACVHDLHAR